MATGSGMHPTEPWLAMDLSRSNLRWTGWLLVSALPVLLVGAVFWRMDFQQPDLKATLQSIAEHYALWLWIHFWLTAGVIVGIAGLAALTEVLRDAGERVLAPAGFAVFVLGAAPWFVAIACRVTVTTWAAAEVAQALPEGYASMHRAMGLMLGIHMTLAYMAALCFGAAILRTELLASPLGWAGVIAGALGLAGVAVSPGTALAPLLALIYPFAIGVGLLRTASAATS